MGNRPGEEITACIDRAAVFPSLGDPLADGSRHG